MGVAGGDDDEEGVGEDHQRVQRCQDAQRWRLVSSRPGSSLRGLKGFLDRQRWQATRPWDGSQ